MPLNDDKELNKEADLRKARRAFLAKSKYAVYMTPVMLSIVVDKDAHAGSNACVKNPPPWCP